MLRAPAAVRVALVTGVLLAVSVGCSKGGSTPGSTGASTTAFASSYRAATESFEHRTASVKERARTALGNDNAVLAVYGDLATVTQQARDEYQRLDPPKDLAPLFETITKLLERQSTVLDGVVQDAKANDGAGLAPKLAELARLFVDWATANQEMDRRISGVAPA